MPIINHKSLVRLEVTAGIIGSVVKGDAILVNTGTIKRPTIFKAEIVSIDQAARTLAIKFDSGIQKEIKAKLTKTGYLGKCKITRKHKVAIPISELHKWLNEADYAKFTGTLPKISHKKLATTKNTSRSDISPAVKANIDLGKKAKKVLDVLIKAKKVRWIETNKSGHFVYYYGKPNSQVKLATQKMEDIVLKELIKPLEAATKQKVKVPFTTSFNEINGGRIQFTVSFKTAKVTDAFINLMKGIDPSKGRAVRKVPRKGTKGTERDDLNAPEEMTLMESVRSKGFKSLKKSSVGYSTSGTADNDYSSMVNYFKVIRAKGFKEVSLYIDGVGDYYFYFKNRKHPVYIQFALRESSWGINLISGEIFERSFSEMSILGDDFKMNDYISLKFINELPTKASRGKVTEMIDKQWSRLQDTLRDLENYDAQGALRFSMKPIPRKPVTLKGGKLYPDIKAGILHATYLDTPQDGVFKGFKGYVETQLDMSVVYSEVTVSGRVQHVVALVTRTTGLNKDTDLPSTWAADIKKDAAHLIRTTKSQYEVA